MEQYGGELNPDLKSGTFTSNNVTLKIRTGGSQKLTISDEQIQALRVKIQQELMKQARRIKERENGSDGEAAAD
jgi:hypothetical protein